jgi:hypothetical protein
MKKFVLAFVVLATLVVALISTGQVAAQGPAPASPQALGTGVGNGGPMGGRGARGGNAAAGFTGVEGLLHDGMLAVFAQELDVPVADLNARLANGETIAQIAAEKGLSAEQFSALMADARGQAIDQAVADGTLTQEQADWLKTRGAQGNGGMAGARGTRGGRGANAGSADCPYFPQANP